MKHFLLPLALVLYHLSSFAQHSTGCQHEEMRISPSQKTASLRTEEMQSVPDTAKLIRIPVVFNVVHLGEKVGEGTNVSDETIKKNIEILNTYYRVKYDPYAPGSDFWYNGTKGIDTKVEFYLADLDSTCNYSSGIRRINGSNLPRYKDIGITYEATSDAFTNEATIKNATGTYNQRYLNVWVVNKIFSNSSVIGYAYMPDGYGIMGKQFGVVAIYNNIDGVIVHEMGHVLGLSHEDMAVDGINGLHGYNIIRQSANFYASQLLAKPLVCQPTVQNEVGLIHLKGFDRAICKGSLAPKVKLKNYGKSALTSCQLNIYNGTQLLTNYTWSGSVNSLDTTWATIPALTLQEGSYNIRVIPASVNGQQDANHQNDTAKATTKVVGFLSAVPFTSNFDGGSIAPFVLSKSDSSDARLLSGAGVGSTTALLLEGHDKESVDGTPPPGSYDPFFPFDDRNKRFFAYSDVCINSGTNKHYKVKYNRYQDSWGSSFFKVLANGIQTASYTSGRERVWKTDSVVASSYSNGNLLLTFQSSCDYSYATIDRYGYGSYILIDNLSIQEIAASPFAFNFVAPASNKGCAPLTATLQNMSTGAPMPVNYHMNLIKDGVVLDTLHQFNTVDFYKSISQSGVYSLKITAFFQDGTTKTFTLPNFANTTNSTVNGPITETFEGAIDWKRDNNSSITSLDWRTYKPGSYGTSNTSLMINQIGVSNGFTTLLLSLENGPYDFSNVHDAVAIKFDRAYAGSSTFWLKDEYLSIKYSADCGKNWKEVYYKTGEGLQTIPVASNAFTTLTTPKSTEWATDLVRIDTLAGLKDVLFRFEFHPSFGNSFYIDNITVGSAQALSLPDDYLNVHEEVVAFPNPASSHLDIKSSSSIKQVRIYDAFGALVTQSDQLPIAIDHLATGVYSALVTTGNGTDAHLKFVKVP